jgi:hypothetical protein
MSRPSSELAHLFRALKAPAAARALPKLADRACEEQWSYEQFAATLLKTEIDSRDSHGGQARIKAARFPARKTLSQLCRRDHEPEPGGPAAQPRVECDEPTAESPRKRDVIGRRRSSPNRTRRPGPTNPSEVTRALRA